MLVFFLHFLRGYDLKLDQSDRQKFPFNFWRLKGAFQRCGIDGKPTWRGGGVFTYGNMEILTTWTITMNIPWFTAGICEIRNPSLANLALQQLGLVGHLDALPSEVFGAPAFPAIWGLDSESHRVSQSTAQHRTKRLKCVEERKQAKGRSYILFYSTNWGLFS